MPLGKNGGVKAVVDTNTLVSGLLWRGNPSLILDAILDNRIELCLTEELVAELTERPSASAARQAGRGTWPGCSLEL